MSYTPVICELYGFLLFVLLNFRTGTQVSILNPDSSHVFNSSCE